MASSNKRNDNYSLYKSLYDRELDRREKLDASINIPVTVLTLIVGLNSIYLKNINLNSFKDLFIFQNVVLILVAISFLVSLFFLVSSFNNFFKGFSYKHLAIPSEIRAFELKVQEYNSTDKIQKLSFEDGLIDSLIRSTDNNIILNTSRSLNLYRSKTFTIITLFLTGLLLTIIITKNF